MEIFLAVLMALGIFLVAPTIIGFFIVAVYSGLFRVILDRLQRRIAAFRRERIRVRREPIPLGRTTQTAEETIGRRVA